MNPLCNVKELKNESALELERIRNELAGKTTECEGIRNESVLKC